MKFSYLFVLEGQYRNISHMLPCNDAQRNTIVQMKITIPRYLPALRLCAVKVAFYRSISAYEVDEGIIYFTEKLLAMQRGSAGSREP